MAASQTSKQQFISRDSSILAVLLIHRRAWMDSSRECCSGSISLSQCRYHLCYFTAPLSSASSKIVSNGYLVSSCDVFRLGGTFLTKQSCYPLGQGEVKAEVKNILQSTVETMWSQVTLYLCPEATRAVLVVNPLKTCISKHLSFRNTLWNTIFSCWAFYLFTADRQKRVKIVLGSSIAFGDTE